MAPRTTFGEQQHLRDMNFQQVQGDLNADYQESGAALGAALGAGAGAGEGPSYFPIPLIALSAIGMFIYYTRR